ncbi:MAG: sodium:proton antiporter [Bacteroidales bacterium]|nr:sodium:proton antiporter [Bacteroidales bacterium]
MNSNKEKIISAKVAIIPFVVLLFVLIFVIKNFGDSALEGASQVSLLIASAVCVAISMIFYKIPWTQLEETLVSNIKSVGSAVIMLLLIGGISSTWMLSGVVPTLIYYGLQIINPKIFLFASCIISALVSLLVGSSWTTIATIGIALVGIGNSLGFESYWIAGAVISGAYFGDKISPLSDTTILASSSAGAELFPHIRYMLVTTIPSFVISLIIFLVAGFAKSAAGADSSTDFLFALTNTFTISPWLLTVPLLTGVLIAFKLPALITLFASILFASIAMIISQPQIIATITSSSDLSVNTTAVAVFKSLYAHIDIETNNTMLNTLVATKGMSGMLNTIWLIICAMCFGGVMVGSGMIKSITTMIIRYVKGRAAIVSSTVFTGLFCNICLADQYLSIILTNSLFKDFYEKKGYEARLLSRSTEDSATVTSVIIPWNSCGVTQATILNVTTLAYLPYCFFNIISPIMSIIIAIIGYRITPPTPEQDSKQ